MTGETGELVHLVVSHGVARLTLDSQHNRNALSAQLRRELLNGLRQATADDAVRVIVLAHEGTVFCAGADLKEVAAASADEFTEILRTMLASPKPVVAQVEGPARAGGLGLIAASDLAIASRTATFALSEVRRGLVAAVISVPLVPKMTPRGARELFLTGETFDADRAAAVGLLTRAVEAGDVRAEVDRCVELLVGGAPGAVAATKQMLASAELLQIDRQFAAMTDLSAHHFESAEGREGVASFVEKRPPNWARSADEKDGTGEELIHRTRIIAGPDQQKW